MKLVKVCTPCGVSPTPIGSFVPFFLESNLFWAIKLSTHWYLVTNKKYEAK